MVYSEYIINHFGPINEFWQLTEVRNISKSSVNKWTLDTVYSTTERRIDWIKTCISFPHYCHWMSQCNAMHSEMYCKVMAGCCAACYHGDNWG